MATDNKGSKVDLSTFKKWGKDNVIILSPIFDEPQTLLVYEKITCNGLEIRVD